MENVEFQNRSVTELEKEIRYYKKQLDEQSGQILKIQHMASEVSNDLFNMKRGYTLLNELQREFITQGTIESLYSLVVQKLVTGLQMSRAVILIRVGSANVFRVGYSVGFSTDEDAKIKLIDFPISGYEMTNQDSILVNKETPNYDFIDELRRKLNTQYFILTPIKINNEIIAYIFTGRLTEKKLISPKIDSSYLETIHAIAGFISATIYQLEINRNLDSIVKKRTTELNNTIEELLRVRIGKKAMTVIFITALIIFLLGDAFVDPFLHTIVENFYIILIIKSGIALLIKPLETLLEKYLLSRSRKKFVVLSGT